MIILIDQDDVLNHLLPAWIVQYNHDWQDNLDVSHITSWDLVNFVKPECGVKVYDYLTHDFFRHLPIQEGAVEAVKALADRYEVVIVTDAFTAPKSMHAKIDWLQEHFPFLSSKNLVYTSDKSRIRGDILIDDGPHHLNAFPGIRIAMDMPYNRHVETEHRVADWLELHKAFQTGTFLTKLQEGSTP